MSDVPVGEPRVIAQIGITIREDKVSWDIGDLSIPDVVFWLDTVRHMILSQVMGEANVVQS